MVFSRGQTTKRVGNFLSRQFHRVFDFHSFDHSRQGGTTGKRRRAPISQKSRRFDAAIVNAQAQAQSIAAYRVGFFRDGVGISEFSAVARISQVIFEDF